jgi:hypothetical protein
MTLNAANMILKGHNCMFALMRAAEAFFKMECILKAIQKNRKCCSLACLLACLLIIATLLVRSARGDEIFCGDSNPLETGGDGALKSDSNFIGSGEEAMFHSP